MLYGQYFYFELGLNYPDANLYLQCIHLPIIIRGYYHLWAYIIIKALDAGALSRICFDIYSNKRNQRGYAGWYNKARSNHPSAHLGRTICDSVTFQIIHCVRVDFWILWLFGFKFVAVCNSKIYKF